MSISHSNIFSFTPSDLRHFMSNQNVEHDQEFQMTDTADDATATQHEKNTTEVDEDVDR